jgi:hypothetical protein
MHSSKYKLRNNRTDIAQQAQRVAGIFTKIANHRSRPGAVTDDPGMAARKQTLRSWVRL